jgi:hypothetical protein
MSALTRRLDRLEATLTPPDPARLIVVAVTDGQDEPPAPPPGVAVSDNDMVVEIRRFTGPPSPPQLVSVAPLAR